MNDQKATIVDLKKMIKQMVDERDWNQFHAPKNLAMDISIEANELMEKFLWIDNRASFDELKTNRQEIEDECADVLIALLCFANACDIDLSAAFAKKLQEVKAKYPVEKSKGRYTKYNQL